MDARRIAAVALAISAGFLVSHATAGPLLKVQVELAPGQSGQLGPGDSNVLLNVWAYVAGQNNSTADDGVLLLQGALKSANGGLLGDLAFALNASGRANDGLEHGGFNTPPINSPGRQKDLDGDGDLDVGDTYGNYAGSDPNYFNWICANSSPGTYMPTNDGNRVLLGTAIFTLTDPVPVFGESTTINWSYRVRTSNPNRTAFFVVDGWYYALQGDSNQVGTGPDALVTWGEELTIAYVVPEPAMLALLALGGVAMLRRRRK